MKENHTMADTANVREPATLRSICIKVAIALILGIVIMLLPRPENLTPEGQRLLGLLAVVVFFLKFLLLSVLLSGVSAVFARLRIDQLSGLGWKVLAPLALVQLLVVILMGV